MNLSLKQIRYFIASAETGQISLAAMNMHVSQSAITTAIKGLENLLDTQLFTRSSNGVELTQEGHQFLQHAKHIMASVDEALRLPSRSNTAISGPLKLVMSYTVAGYFIAQYISRFSRSFPRVALQLFEADRARIEEGVISGEYDLAVMLTSNLANQEDIAYETLFQSKRRLWLSSNHKLLEQPVVTLQDVSKEPYIMLTVDEASNTAQRYWNRTRYRPDVKFRTSSVEAVRSMVANGSGVTILSDMVYRPWSLEGHRVEIKALADQIPTMDVGMAWARNKEQIETSKAFIEFMHLAIGSQQPNI